MIKKSKFPNSVCYRFLLLVVGFHPSVLSTLTTTLVYARWFESSFSESFFSDCDKRLNSLSPSLATPPPNNTTTNPPPLSHSYSCKREVLVSSFSATCNGWCIENRISPLISQVIPENQKYVLLIFLTRPGYLSTPIELSGKETKRMKANNINYFE